MVALLRRFERLAVSAGRPIRDRRRDQEQQPSSRLHVLSLNCVVHDVAATTTRCSHRGRNVRGGGGGGGGNGRRRGLLRGCGFGASHKRVALRYELKRRAEKLPKELKLRLPRHVAIPVLRR